MAEPRSESVEVAKVALTRNDGDQLRARSGARPQLTATASYERSLANEFQGVFDDIDLGGGGTGDGGTDFSTLPFGRANTWRATLSFSQNLYSGGRIGVQKHLASLGRTTAEQALVGARAQLRFDVTQA
jgi:outer membrane protein TolC